MEETQKNDNEWQSTHRPWVRGLAIVLVCIFVLSSVGMGVWFLLDTPRSRLATPVLTLNGAVVAWTRIDNASGYRIYVDGQAVQTLASQATSFNLNLIDMQILETYPIRVRALSENQNLHSYQSNIIAFTAGISFTVYCYETDEPSRYLIRAHGNRIRICWPDEENPYNRVNFTTTFTIDGNGIVIFGDEVTGTRPLHPEELYGRIKFYNCCFWLLSSS